MLKKLIKWSIATLLLLIALFFMLNQFDEKLQPEAELLLKPRQTQIPPEKNAYFSLIGLAAPSGVSAASWGLKISQSNASQDKQPAAAKPLCDLEEHHCLRIARQYPQQLQDALLKQQELTARYLSARQLPQFVEDGINPYPNFSAAFRAQTLRHAQIGLWAAAGQMDAVWAELAEDMAFQRRNLAGAQTLIGKMVSLSALQRDYVLLADLVHEQPDARASALLTPLTPAEQDMLPAIQHEFRLASNDLRAFKYDLMREESGQTASWMDFIRAPLMEHLLLRNATINRVYQLEQADEALARALPTDFAHKRAEAQALTARFAVVNWRNVYNPVGKWLIDYGRADYHRYIRRPVELDAFLRLLTLQQQIISLDISANDIPHFLASSATELHDPFTGQAVAWDAVHRELFIATDNSPLQYLRFGKNRQRIALPLSVK